MTRANVLPIAGSSADTVEDHRAGACTVILQLPFEHGGKRVDRVVVGPFTFGHTLQWQDGVYKSWVELMLDVCTDARGNPLDMETLRKIRHPDADRIQTRFFEMMPEAIRENVAAPRYEPLVQPPSAERELENARILAESMDDQDAAPAAEDRGFDFGS